MSLKNEAQSALHSTKSFYKEYVSGMDRETLGREFHADSDRLKQLYIDAISEPGKTADDLPAHTKILKLFNALAQRLSPTRRLIFGLSIIGFLFFSIFMITGFQILPGTALLFILSFAAVLALLLLELLEKADVKRELDLARDIQLSLLPNTALVRDNIEIYAFANTANEVGGDYVDIIQTENGTYVIVADVSGKGLSAALYMVRLQALVHLLIKKSEPTPKELFLELNNYVKSNKRDKTFVTACAAFFPDGEDNFIFARAGHNTPILYSKEKDTTTGLKTGGFALGMTSTRNLKHQLEERLFEFHAGDSLLLYTDGLTEARNEFNEEYGTERLESLMSVYGSLHAKSICQKIQTSLEAYIGSEKTMDDITFATVHHRE